MITRTDIEVFLIIFVVIYGFYRLIKFIIKRIPSYVPKCPHPDEPNHDRPACIDRQSITFLVIVYGLIILGSIGSRGY